jgi:DNA-binding MarR family transcriptional regulator
MKEINTEMFNALQQKFARIVGLYEKLERTPRAFGTGELLTSSEIHLIETIGDQNEQLSVTDLANFIGITKGAVSQMLKKLEYKLLTKKYEDSENLSRSIVKLTSKGKAAYFAHKHWHETMDGGYENYYRGLDEDKVLFLLDFLTKVEDFLQRAIKPDH